jgi:hypothetical protein
MSRNLERALTTLKEIRTGLKSLNVKTVQRRKREAQEGREDTQERRQRLLERQVETEKELESAERLLGRLQDEDESEESDEELALVELIEDLELERKRRQKAIGHLWRRQRRQGERFRELHELAQRRTARRRKLNARRKKVLARIKEIKEAQAQPQPGEGPRCGSVSIGEQIVTPIFQNAGVPITSRLRAANHPLSIDNPSSDHNAGNTCNYALDGGTANNRTMAQKIKDALGSPGPIVDLQFFNVSFAGHPFRIQIIFSTHGTGPHLHVGIRRA